MTEDGDVSDAPESVEDILREGARFAHETVENALAPFESAVRTIQDSWLAYSRLRKEYPFVPLSFFSRIDEPVKKRHQRLRNRDEIEIRLVSCASRQIV